MDIRIHLTLSFVALPLTVPPFAPWFAPTQEFAPKSALEIAPESLTEHPEQQDV